MWRICCHSWLAVAAAIALRSRLGSRSWLNVNDVCSRRNPRKAWRVSGTAEAGSPDLEGLPSSVIGAAGGDGNVFAEHSSPVEEVSGDVGVSLDSGAVIEGLLVDGAGLVEQSEEAVLGPLEVPLALGPAEFPIDGGRRKPRTLGNVAHRPSAGPLEGEEGRPPGPLLVELLIEAEAGVIIRQHRQKGEPAPSSC